MYPMEYTCTTEDTNNTGISIDTVKASNLKAQSMCNDSRSIHLNKLIETDVLLHPTSKKRKIAKKVVMATQLHVMSCAPVIPIFLPKKPETIEPNNGSKIKTKYIKLNL